MSRRPHPLARALALALLVAAPQAAPLAMPAAAAERPGDADQARWQERIGAARAEVEQARQRSESAAQAVQRMRHRKHPRGAAREALFAEREAANQARAEAERSLDELLEEARRAGVPPGWLRTGSAQPAAAVE